ncbi:hypothetical protein ACFVAQ_20155 [Streptomyces sp. NPDC057651]|uniref:hypothetical protein n=1 Tax=Streptomyces sp. NPDC057651 TaxID=3346194 RepID=UPI0036741645
MLATVTGRQGAAPRALGLPDEADAGDLFRSADQDLTTSGTYIEMASRVTEPVLLGLALLAVRNRVKR